MSLIEYRKSYISVRVGETRNRETGPNINNQYYDNFNSHSVSLFVSLSQIPQRINECECEYGCMHVSAAMLGYLYTSHVLNRSTIIVNESSIGSRAYWAVVVVGKYTT